MKKVLISLCALAGVIGGIHAQDRTFSISTRPSNPSVTAMAEGSDGYLWVGTLRGLNRYNGATYTTIGMADSTGLTSDRIYSLCADTDGRLWVGTETGINLVQNSQVVRRPEPQFMPVTAILDYDEEQLLYSGPGGLGIYGKQSGESRIILDLPVYFYITYLVRDPITGRIFAAKANLPEIAVLDQNFALMKTLAVRSASSINGMTFSPDGSLFVATDKGLKCWNPDGSENPAWDRMLKAEGAPSHIAFVQTDYTSGHVLVGASGGKIYSLSVTDGTIHRLWIDVEFDSSSRTLCLVTPDRLWIASRNQGIVQRSRTGATSIQHLQELSSTDFVSRLVSWTENQILISTYRKVLRMDTRHGEYTDLTPPLQPGKTITHMRVDRRGHIWLILDYLLLREYELDPATDRLKLLSERPVSGVHSLWENQDGSISFIQENRIHTLRDGVLTSRPIGQAGGLWRVMTTWTGTTYLINGDSICQYNPDGQLLDIPVWIPSPNIVTVDTAGRIWVGSSNNGLVCYDPADGSCTRLSVRDGLPDNAIRSILPNDKGIWVSTRNAIVFISPDLQQILPIPLDGQEPVEFVSNGATVNTSGDLIFGAKKHVVRVEPKQYSGIAEEHLELDALLVDNAPVDLQRGEVLLKPEQSQLSLYFSAIDFEFGKQLQYAYKLEGYNRQWVQVGNNPYALITDLPAGRFRFLARVRTPDGIWQEEQELCRIRHKPTPLRSPVAIVIYSLLFFLFLSQLVRLVRHNRQNRDRAERAEMEKVFSEQASRDKADFYMNISHEYRTPLTLIYGPAQDLARNNNLDEHDRKLVRCIQRNAEMLMTLTEQIMNFHLFSRSSDHLAILQTDLGAMLSASIANFDYFRDQRGIRLSSELPQDLLVWCDRDKIGKVFFNLLSNAFKYTPQGGEIHVTATLHSKEELQAAFNLPESDYDGPFARISVADTGVGISQDQIERIFNRFERLEQEVEGREPKGFGIGLNHALYLVSQHHGAIKAAPNRPQGSVFSFVFPAGKDAYEDAEIWHDVPVESTGKLTEPAPVLEADHETSLLIVEDNSEMRVYLHDLFHDTYNVILAGDGEEASRFIRISAPDLIVSDIMMPFKDGFQLCREVKESEEYSHIPVILLTAKTGMADHLEGLELGADAYIQKPFDPDLLRAQIRNLMNNRRRVQKLLHGKTSDQIGEVLPSLGIGLRDKAFLEHLYALVEEHLGEEEFNVSTLSTSMAMSRSGLFSKLKALTGQSPQEFLTGYRLNRARELLKSREFNVSEVAYKVGFSTLNGFSRAFKNKYGIPPSAL